MFNVISPYFSTKTISVCVETTNIRKEEEEEKVKGVLRGDAVVSSRRNTNFVLI